ncbi:CHAT domain-containing protein [Achromobacter mucicolens]|uniref:CHAT domain-containing protein n=1 Tax=Achromobacter mucicolens TaxID=1389922 RepID=UPI00244B6335|nr:CHAT domain-containing protein [Achromobacter mucicolens]MDH0090315.1 CHAT domain-containing protein [Achromobacter mucicolens]
MSLTTSQAVSEEFAYSKHFVELDAALSGHDALETLWRTTDSGATHAIIHAKDREPLSFFLFESHELRGWLIGNGRRRLQADLSELMKLSTARRSPVVRESQAPIAGAVVVRGEKVVGFVPGGLPPFELEFRVPDLDELFVDSQSMAASAVAVSGPELQGGEEAPSAPPPARFFNARTPDSVVVNAETYLIVQVAREAVLPTEGMASGHASVGDFFGTLTIDVHAPGLKSLGPTTRSLNVPLAGDSEKLRFGFIALKEGVRQIDVMAWNGSAQVAGVSLQIAVGPVDAAGGTSEVSGDFIWREPESGEYTLVVAWEPDSRRYRFQLRNDERRDWDYMYSEPLLYARQQTYDSMIAALNAQARNLYALSVADQAMWLQGMGTLLFDQLVPDALRLALLENQRKIRILNIKSGADPTPWELLFLADPDTGEGDFLGNSAIVARWNFGEGPSRSLKRATSVLVLPTGAPPQAAQELQHLQAALGGAEWVGNLTRLNALMKSGVFDLLHFAAHNINVPGTPGGAYVAFGPQQRWDLAFVAMVPRNKFKSRGPLVFMNACTTAGTTELYSDLASWADQFLRCGSGAFIGTLWEVRDSSARLFSEIFYQELLKGQTLGAAMQAARAKLRDENAGDPTPLAYTLYGNPLARLEVA